MKLFIPSIIHDKRGEIGTIAVLVGMVVIGLGILLGSQIRNGNINISPRAAAAPDPLWNGALSSKTKDATTDVYLWSGGGPTTGWESYIGNRAYFCNGKWCWTLLRHTSPPTWADGGKPFDMSKEPGVNGQLGYKDLKSPPNTDIKPWTGNGPTAAWTWVLPTQMNGYTVNETLLCNGIYCWRHIRYPDGANQTSGWRDNGLPLNMKEAGVWKDDTKMWAGSGLSVGWNDPINGKATVCNESQNYCRSMSYKNNQWAWLNDSVSYPSGVSKFTSAWTSPATNIQTRCTANVCYNFNSSTNQYEGSSFLIAPQPTNTPLPSVKTCPVGQLLCANTCINVTNNAQHCGACGKACTVGQTCSNSQCVATAPTTVTVRVGINESDSLTNHNVPTVAAYKLNTTEKIVNCTTTTTLLGRTRTFNCAGLTPGTSYTYKAVYTGKSATIPTINAQINGNASSNVLHDMSVSFANKMVLSPATPVAGGPLKITLTGKKFFTPVAQLVVKGTGPSNFSLNRTEELPINSTTFNKSYDVTVPTAGTYKISVSVAEGYKATIPGSTLIYDSFTFTVVAPTATKIPTNTPTPTSAIPTCKSDSDGGNTPNVAGSITLSNGEYRADSCSGSQLTEYYCSGTTATSVKHTCQYGCGAFKCLPAPTSTPPNGGIGAITLASPINGVVLPIGNVTLRWNAATNATSYDWSVNRSSRGFKTGTGGGTTAVTNLLPGSYTWQVTAKNANGTRASSFGEFKIPFSKIKPLNNTQITFGSTYSFEWTPLLPTDMNVLYFMVYNSASSTNPVYYKEIRTNSTEYTTGKLSLALNANTDSDFVSGRAYTWQLIASRAGTAQEHMPPNDNTGSPQSFTLVPASTIIPTATLTVRPATPTLTPIASTATSVPSATTVPCPKRAQGDANCDGIIDYIDFVCWRGELSRSKPTNCISADFDNSGSISSADYSIWRNIFITSIQ